MTDASRRGTDPLAPVLLGVWFGAVAGLLEGLVHAGRVLLLHRAIHLGVYVAWMPAAANLFWLGLLGTGFALAAVAWAPLRQPRIWLLVFGFAAAWDVASLWTPPLTGSAVIFLSIGIAVVVMRIVMPRLGGFRRVVGVTVPLLVLIIGLTGAGIEGWRRYREQHIVAGLAPAGPGRPNVLLLVLDTVRSMNLSVYGYLRATTPTMEALAARGAVFEHTISTAPWTLPGHAALFTGRWVHEQGTDWDRPLDDRWPVLSEVLARQGYTSGGFIANVSYVDRSFGLARGFAHYEDYPLTWRQVAQSSPLSKWITGHGIIDRAFGPGRQWTRKNAADVTGEFLDWEARQPADRPWFGFLNFFDAHREYWSPPGYDTLFTADSARAPLTPIRPLKGAPARNGRRVPQVEYDRAIRYIDDRIGATLAELDRRGALKNTLVIVTADHGEEFEEHGLVGHGNSLYFPSLSIPMVMALPGRVPAGVRIPQTISSRNLPATVMDLIGAPPEASPFPGASLARYWSAAPPLAQDSVLAELTYAWGKPAWIPVSKGNMVSAFEGPRHLIRDGGGGLELYDIDADRWEQTDILPQSAERPDTKALHTMLGGVPIRPRPDKPPPGAREGIPQGE